MYASINDSTYVEQTQTVVDALSHEHTMMATLPNLEAGSITITDFLTSFLVVTADPILVFNSEYPDGILDIAGIVVDNLDGTWTVPFTEVFTVAPTSVHMYPDLTNLPVVSVQAETTIDRLVMLPETLVFTSALATQFVGTSPRAGMLAIGDTITITDGITPTDVVLTAVVETGTIPAITYTCTYVTAIIATADATIPDRSIAIPALSRVRNGKSVAQGGTDVTITYANTVNPGTITWNEIARKIVSPINWTITEPFIMDYTEEIHVT